MVDFTLYRFQVGSSAHLDSAVSGSQGARPRRGPSDPAARQGDILPEGAGRGKRGPVAPHILHNSHGTYSIEEGLNGGLYAPSYGMQPLELSAVMGDCSGNTLPF